jgi:hypothetical protein
MTLKEYYNELRRHDWYYEYSDDHGVWRRGCDNHNKLRSMSDESQDHKKMWIQFNNWKMGKGELPNEPTK